MATAVQTSTEPRSANPRVKLTIASLLGAVFVIAGIVVAAYFVPMLWERFVAPSLASFGMTSVFLRVAVQIAVVAGIVWVGSKLAGDAPPHGIRGGIFLVISLLIVIFFIVRAVGLNFQDSVYGLPITVVILGGLLGLAGRFLVSPRAARWMIAIGEQGWFHTLGYKRTQGVRARRYTMIGILLLGLTGVYTLYNQGTLGTGDWTLVIPFTGDPNLSITLLADIQHTALILLAAATFWIAWRAVNVPTFADFLIATEAEMNKVSWSNRRRLLPDTIVVLVTVILLTLFLLVVDLFWGWLLSLPFVGVLPDSAQPTTSAPADVSKPKQNPW